MNDWLVVSFTFVQHPRSYQNGYHLISDDDDFIVLPHLEIRMHEPCFDIPFIHIILTLSKAVPPYPINAERQARKRQISLL